MKKAALLGAAAVVLGGLVGVLMARDPGYLLATYDGMAVETSLWFGVLILLAAYAALRLLLFVGGRLIRGKGLFESWRRNRRSQTAAKYTASGLLLLEQGDWEQAKRLLAGAAANVAAPAVNFLGAAQAAHELGAFEERDQFLSQARQADPAAKLSIALLQTRLQMAAEQWRPALDALLEIHAEAPKHPLLAQRLWRCHEALGDWQALTELAPKLRKAKAMNDEALEALERRAWRRRIEAAEGLGAWEQAPRKLKQDPELVLAAARKMSAGDDLGAAEALLRETLGRTWSNDLLHLYGSIRSPQPEKQLAAVQGWLRKRPDDGELLLAAGRIALMNADWAKAREFLEASLRINATPTVQAELGRLLTALGESRRGGELLARAVGDLPELPLPARSG